MHQLREERLCLFVNSASKNGSMACSFYAEVVSGVTVPRFLCDVFQFP